MYASTTSRFRILQILIKTSSSWEKHLLTGVLLGNINQEVADAPRVTPLIVVPGNQLDEVLVQLDTSFGVEDGRCRVADEIGGDDILVSVFENTLVLALGSSLDDVLDLLVSSLLLEANDEVNDGDIDGRNTERKTAIDRRLVGSEDKR